MDSPTNTGSSNQWLKRSNSNQGTWTTLPSASSSQSGLMSSSHYNKVSNMTRYVTWSSGSSSSTMVYRMWDNDFMEVFARVTGISISVSTALGNWYRSNSPFTDTSYRYTYSFRVDPMITCQFVSTNNASAVVWLNPTPSKVQDYLPPLYLIRPTTATVQGYMTFYVCGWT